MGLVLVIILKINNTALESWNFHIGSLTVQPNTVIAVLTVIGQSLMMVPVTSALGQLKWDYFKRPRCLYHMQLMDDASRGPWGSFLLLLRVASTRSLVGSLLALVTIVALGIGPSAQQILDFTDTLVQLHNVTAEIGLATNYSSKSYVSQFGTGTGRAYFTSTYNSDMFKLQSSLIDGLAGSVFTPNFVCPGDTCTWPDYTSLGVCGRYYNLTDRIEANCTGDNDLLNCTYGIPDSLTGPGSNESMEVTFANQNTALSPATTIFQSSSVIDLGGSLGFFAVKVLQPSKSPIHDYAPPTTEISYSNWTWCAKTYGNNTGTPAATRSQTVTSERLVQTDFLSDKRGEAGSGSVVFTTESGLEFYVDHNTQIQLFRWLGSFLERSIVDRYPHTGTQMDDDNFNLGFFLYASDLSAVTQDLADTLTNQIRSTNPGDNLNSTSLTGDAYISQTYISVRWQWIVLPLVEILVTSILLAYCIISTRSGPLLKSSVLAFLFHPLEGLTDEELNKAEHKSSSELETESKKVIAKFEGGPDGRMRFCRA